MRLKVFAPRTLTRELGFLGAACPNTLDITFLSGEQALRDGTGSPLQGCIDRIDSEGPGAYDAIVFALGADQLPAVTSRWFPLVLPRVHDGASLLLGSAQRYRDICEATPGGLFWYTPGSLERRMPDGVFSGELTRYAPACGAENARFLLGMEHDWVRFGGKAAYVQLPGVPYPSFQACCEACAAYLGWPLTVHEGDSGLLHALLGGSWDERFLTVAPEQSFALSYRQDIFRVAR